MKKLIRYLLKKYGSYDIDNIGGLERMNKRRAWCAENVETLGLSVGTIELFHSELPHLLSNVGIILFFISMLNKM